MDASEGVARNVRFISADFCPDAGLRNAPRLGSSSLLFLPLTPARSRKSCDGLRGRPLRNGACEWRGWN